MEKCKHVMIIKQYSTMKKPQVIGAFFCGGPTRARTVDPQIMSLLL